MINGRPLIAVITARPSEREQKIMLEGIMSEAEKYGFYIAVIANIYNFSNIENYFAHVAVENKIYELAESERIDGVILMLETVSYSDLKEKILKKLEGKKIPIVVAGDVIEGYTCINNDIRKDFHEIACHITEVHRFTDIDIITGQEEYETSHERVQGMRDVLEEKGINFSDENIIFSNYWITGGEKIANEYISGKRRLPQAIVCANDYMAYGLIDTFFKNGITPPEDVTVVGYEYSGERYYHSPILTTYYRNRSAVGAKAMNVLYSMISGNESENNVSLNGCMVCGDTCSCGIDKKFLGKELEEVRTAQFYNSMTVCGNFEQKLAVCRSLSDYIRALQDYSYLIRNLKGLYLCLYEDWFSLKDKSPLDIDSNDKMMTFYRLISPIEYPSEPHYFVRKMLFPENLPGSGDKLFLYFVPMFTDGTEIGYFIFQYTIPDSYDPIAVDWINSAVNALNVIRMKNDINELLEYNNLSAFRDTTTGLYNKNGIIRELERSLKKSSKDDTISAVMIKARLFFDNSRIDEKNISVKIDLEISECLKKAAIDSSAFCAKLQDKQFLFAAIGKLPENYDKIIADRVVSLITHSPLYKSLEYMDNIISAGITCNISEIDTKNLIDKLSDEINKETALLFEKYKTADYNKYNILRASIYKSPEKQWNAETVCRDFHISSGHFRAEYKNIFGLSFHKDIIQSRIAMAKYLLMTTSLNLLAIAVKCGYDDDKYFIRQFRQITGISPNAYRKFSVVS
ncbi:MAG: substrate-binding domain-containing protein [Ruminococcus sp.]|nr:substrate-binding domain-containing protein [Ruminococcus sp.]